MFEWDDGKRESNIAKHGVDFSAVEGFEFDTALVVVDTRFDYGETREIAIGFIGARLHTLVFVRRSGNIRIVSLRKSHKKEVAYYAGHI